MGPTVRRRRVLQPPPPGALSRQHRLSASQGSVEVPSGHVVVLAVPGARPTLLRPGMHELREEDHLPVGMARRGRLDLTAIVVAEQVEVHVAAETAVDWVWGPLAIRVTSPTRLLTSLSTSVALDRADATAHWLSLRVGEALDHVAVEGRLAASLEAFGLRLVTLGPLRRHRRAA